MIGARGGAEKVSLSIAWLGRFHKDSPRLIWMKATQNSLGFGRGFHGK